MARERSSSKPPDNDRSSELQVFDFEGNRVRVQETLDGRPWFIAIDPCKALGITNVTRALERLDDDEKSTLTINQGGREYIVNVINESGLYSLILTSRKPEARAFKKWVTSVVLPSIRKTGGYRMGQPGASPDVISLQVAFSELQGHHDDLRREIDVLKRICHLPLRTIPAGFSLLKTFAASHGIELRRSAGAEGKKCVRACEQLGIEPLPYRERDDGFEMHLYPEVVLLHWLASYRTRHPNAGGDLFSSSA